MGCRMSVTKTSKMFTHTNKLHEELIRIALTPRQCGGAALKRMLDQCTLEFQEEPVGARFTVIVGEPLSWQQYDILAGSEEKDVAETAVIVTNPFRGDRRIVHEAMRKCPAAQAAMSRYAQNILSVYVTTYCERFEVERMALLVCGEETANLLGGVKESWNFMGWPTSLVVGEGFVSVVGGKFPVMESRQIEQDLDDLRGLDNYLLEGACSLAYCQV